jgi:hypothetical protein
MANPDRGGPWPAVLAARAREELDIQNFGIDPEEPTKVVISVSGHDLGSLTSAASGYHSADRSSACVAGGGRRPPCRTASGPAHAWVYEGCGHHGGNRL